MWAFEKKCKESGTLFSATGLLCDLGQVIYLPVSQSLIYEKIEVVVTSP